MYIINKETNRIEKIESTTFKQLGFKERENLQEWIAKNRSLICPVIYRGVHIDFTGL